MSELSFLLDILLDHRLPKAVRDLIRARIKEIEASPRAIHIPANAPIGAIDNSPGLLYQGVKQAPSMVKLMEKYPDLVPQDAPPIVVPHVDQPVAVIAHTVQAAAALQSRADAMNGKMDTSKGRPRKW